MGLSLSMSSPDYTDSDLYDSVDILQTILEGEEEQRRKNEEKEIALQALLLATVTYAIGLNEPD